MPEHDDPSSHSTTNGQPNDSGAETNEASDVHTDGYADELSNNLSLTLSPVLKKLKKTMSYHVPCAAVHPTWHHRTGDMHCRLERHSHTNIHRSGIHLLLFSLYTFFLIHKKLMFGKCL